MSQILTFLKNTGIAIPPHITQLISANPESPLKQINRVKQNDSKKLRVQLSECEFELKKVEEDFAEFKRQVKLEKEKESKKN